MGTIKLKIAQEWMRKVEARLKRYEEECEEYYRDGWRHPRCIHGADNWTDYDLMCYWCESDADPFRAAQSDRVVFRGLALNYAADVITNHAKDSADTRDALLKLKDVGIINSDELEELNTRALLLLTDRLVKAMGEV